MIRPWLSNLMLFHIEDLLFLSILKGNTYIFISLHDLYIAAVLSAGKYFCLYIYIYICRLYLNLSATIRDRIEVLGRNVFTIFKNCKSFLCLYLRCLNTSNSTIDQQCCFIFISAIDVICRNQVLFTPTQIEAIRSGMQPGLTMVCFTLILNYF